MRRIIPVLLTAILLLSGCSSNGQQPAAKEVSANEQANKPVYIMAGKVDAGEKADIASKIPARVSEILVDVGSSVKKDDPVIKLDTKDLEAQEAQAQAAVDTAQANLTKIKSGARPQQIAQAQAAMESAGKNYETAKNNYDRTNQLYLSGAASKQQLETAEVQFKAAEAQYNSAKEQLDMLKKGETKETLDVLESQVKQAQAALEVVKTQLDNATIVSPVSGVISAKNINIGELASAGIPLVSVVNTGSLYVNAYLPSGLTGKIKAGQKVIVKVSEVPEKLFQGEISVINPVIDSRNKSILVKVKLKDPDLALKPGMFAEIGLKN